MSSIIKVDQIQLADGSTPTATTLGISTNTPNFSVRFDGSYSLSVQSLTKIQFSSTEWDTASAFDLANNKFVVPSGQGGNYILSTRVHFDNITDGNYAELWWYINGSNTERNRTRDYQSLSQQWIRMHSNLAITLAEGDEVEIYGYVLGGNSPAIAFTQFYGFRIG
jgi:hypothetical protein